MDRINQFFNRIGGIIIWVGLWNLIVLIIPENSIIGNLFLTCLGLVIWVHTNEFDFPDQRQAVDESSISTKQTVQ